MLSVLSTFSNKANINNDATVWVLAVNTIFVIVCFSWMWNVCWASSLFEIQIYCFYCKCRWLGSQVVSMLDSGTEAPRLKSQPRCSRVWTTFTFLLQKYSSSLLKQVIMLKPGLPMLWLLEAVFSVCMCLSRRNSDQSCIGEWLLFAAVTERGRLWGNGRGAQPASHWGPRSSSCCDDNSSEIVHWDCTEPCVHVEFCVEFALPTECFIDRYRV